jgi:NADPH2:quinone reductase
MGSYAEQAVVPADRLIKLPDGVDARLSAAVLLQGMTAYVLTHSTYTLKAGDAVLIHAGAGGTGQLMIQMAKRLGAYVFATVSTDEKAALARAAGADRAIIYTREDFEDEVKRASAGQGVQVVYDSVGKTTFDKSLNCLARGGYLVLYGEASGPVPPVEPWRLVTNSVYLTRPGLTHFIATREELQQCAHEVLSGVISGQLEVHIDRTLPLAAASEAHSAMERRATAGKVLLVP